MRNFFLLVFLSFCSSGISQSISSETWAKIDSLFTHVEGHSPGYGIAVVQNGEFLLQKGYGLANLEYGIPIDSSSVFNVASLSKQFTAACVAVLILDGKLSLDDEVSSFIPELPSYPHPLQVKHLIYMTSGIPEYYNQPRSNGTDWSSLHFFSVDTAIAASLKSNELNFEPGTEWRYSNINYMLLTRIVERVSEMPFAVFAKKRLFDPLGMKQTRFHDHVFEVIPHRVQGYNRANLENLDWLTQLGYAPTHVDTRGYLQIHRNSPHYGGSGVYTSLSDLKKWAGNFESRAFGGDAFYDLMHKRMQFEHDKDNDAFGLVFGDFNGHEIVWYEGGDWGFSSYMMRFPNANLTVFCLSNLGEGRAVRYANRLVDILVDEGVISLK